jgi:transcriptional regulator with XRE-family HTH domain
MSIPTTFIPKRERLAYQADLKGLIFRQIRQAFIRAKESGFTQKEYAARIDMDEGQLSRRLRGDFDLKLETLSDLARGLEYRIDVKLTPLADVPALQRVDPIMIDKSSQKITSEPSEQTSVIARFPQKNENTIGRLSVSAQAA